MLPLSFELDPFRRIDSRYHQRSNVESTFSAIKRKFGDAVHNKNDVAMKNEVLCKLIAPNLTCLIQEQCELGIEAVFWGDNKTMDVSGRSPQFGRIIEDVTKF